MLARAVVCVAWTGLGVALLLGLTSVIEFQFSSDTGIVSYVTRTRYPIQQELFWCYAATLGVPLVVLLGHVLCRLARLGQTPLLCLALHIPLLLLWCPLRALDAEASLAWGGVGFAAVLAAMLPVGLLNRARLTGEGPVAAEGAAACAAAPTRAWVIWLRYLGAGGRWLLLLVAVPVFLYLIRFDPHTSGRVDFFHEGEYLVPLQAAWHGAIPYRDVYLQHGFLHNLGIPWLSAKCFGYSLGAVRTGHSLITPLGWIGAYFFLLGLVRGRVLPALLFAILAAHMPTHLLPRAFFGLCSLGLFAGYLQARGRGRGGLLVGSGLFAAVALLHSLEVGLYTLAATGVVLVARVALSRRVPFLRRLRAPAVYGCGAGLVVLPFLVWLAVNGAAVDCFQNVYLQIVHQLEVWGRPFPSPLKLFAQLLSADRPVLFSEWIVSPQASLLHAPIVLMLAGVWLAATAVHRRFIISSAWWCLLLFAVAGNLFFRTNLGRSDGAHYHYGYMIALLFAVYVVDALLRRAATALFATGVPPFARAACLPALACVALVVLCAAHWIGENPNRRYGYRDWREGREALASLFPVPPDSQLVPHGQWAEIESVVRACQSETAPDEPIYDFSNQSAYLFFCGRRTASRYFMPVYVPTPAAQRELIGELEAARPQVVIYRGHSYNRIDGCPTESRVPLVTAYLREHYRPWRQADGVQLWRREVPAATVLP